jgi:hypothetical protein
VPRQPAFSSLLELMSSKGETMMLRTGAQPAPTIKPDRQFRSWSLLVGVIAGFSSSCILDERCDEDQVHKIEGTLDYCECAPGTIRDPKGYGCRRCSSHEVVKNDMCVCKEGFAKASPNGSCEAVTGQVIGAECSDASSCIEPYPYCASDGPERYCTLENCTDSNCPDGYTCETIESQKFCAKLPTGLDATCTSNEDCAAFDASECDTFNRKCVLGGCAAGRVQCPSTWICCDIGMFLPGTSFCAAPGGMCPGKVVTP